VFCSFGLDQITAHERGGLLCTYGVENEGWFWWRILNEKDHLVERGVDRNVILNRS